MNINWKIVGLATAGTAVVMSAGYGLYALFKTDKVSEPLVEGSIHFDDITQHENTRVGYGHRILNGKAKPFTFSYLNLGSYSIIKAVWIESDNTPVFSAEEANYFVNLMGVPGQFTTRPTDQGFILDHVAA